MSQCHDTYDEVEGPRAGEVQGHDRSLGGAQCHDSYDAEDGLPAPSQNEQVKVITTAPGRTGPVVTAPQSETERPVATSLLR